MRLSLVMAVLAGCGRLGFDGEARNQPDAALPTECPDDMAPTKPGGDVCIERAQRGEASWLASKADCGNLDRRLCGDAEWNDGCEKEPSLVGMTDGWEWMAEEDAGLALKRGDGACDATSSHEIDSTPYGYRCCLALAPQLGD